MIDITTFNSLVNDFFFYSQQYLDRYAFLFPLGLIGIWRWGVWTMKEIIGLHYHPTTKPYAARVSLVIPVYNENPQVFKVALASWKNNKPAEIIAVIDYTDTTCIKIFKEFAKTFPGAKLIITKTPGKRAALVDGIKVAKSEIVALVDSDTIWSDTVLAHGLSPFNDKKVAGVGTYQSVLNAKTFAQKIFDIQLDLRYRTEYPFLAAAGDALVCLSGRTAFYRRSVVAPMLPDLLNETFMGKPVISGDDKRLTYLVLAAGWKVKYQNNARVYTPGMKDLGSYLKQRLRWSRNSLRADLKALWEGWPRHHPALLFFQIDKLLQSIVVILSPIYFFVSLYFHLWIAAAVIFAWWMISRAIKMFPHLHRHPENIVLVPGYAIFSFFAGLVKIYALFTLDTQGWITRWDKSRLIKLRIFNTIFAYAATFGIVLLLTLAVTAYKQHFYVIPHAEHEKLLQTVLPKTNAVAIKAPNEKQPFVQKKLLVSRYEVKRGESIASIAKTFGVAPMQLYYANAQKLPNASTAPVGTVLSIPGTDMLLASPTDTSIFPVFPVPLKTYYDKSTNTLLVSGKGNTVTLKDIQNNGGKQYLEEVAPKVWRATATILIYKGVTLNLHKNEVTWLKLESNKNGYIALRALDGNLSIDGVKITSWDSSKNAYDIDQKDGRSFVFVKDNARMDINNSELAYLGFATSADLAISPYGVSWKMSRDKLKTHMLTGEVINSKFHDNYFGTYTFGATGMLWRGNEFYANTRYGLDPHDDSNGFLVEENYSHNNGTHGIIFSKRCMYNIIRNNISINNGLHGIMLHEASDYNVIENNTTSGEVSGIALYHSSHNSIHNNKMEGNEHGIRANVSSSNNNIYDNYIANSKGYGVYFYDNADKNIVRNNVFEFNNVGIYVKSNENSITENTLTNNVIGIYFLAKASKNTLANNHISQSAIYGVYTKIASTFQNNLGENTLYRNRVDIDGQQAEGN